MILHQYNYQLVPTLTGSINKCHMFSHKKYDEKKGLEFLKDGDSISFDIGHDLIGQQRYTSITPGGKIKVFSPDAKIKSIKQNFLFALFMLPAASSSSDQTFSDFAAAWAWCKTGSTSTAGRWLAHYFNREEKYFCNDYIFEKETLFDKIQFFQSELDVIFASHVLFSGTVSDITLDALFSHSITIEFMDNIKNTFPVHYSIGCGIQNNITSKASAYALVD